MLKTRRPLVTLPLFERAYPDRIQDSIDASLESLRGAADDYGAWVIPFSGGKDSGCVVSLVLWAIEQEYVPRPFRLLVLRSDTTYELPELNDNAEAVMQRVRDEGWEAVTVGPKRMGRFYVGILGRGLVPPNPAYKGRWCTRSLKTDPMKEVIERVSADINEPFLLMSGVRLGESRQRDEKLTASKLASMACSATSGECGTGGIWMDKRMSNAYVGLPLIVNWRECHVYDWLQGWFKYGDGRGHGFEDVTSPIAWMYGQHEDGLVERSMRFGCIGCPVVHRDRMTEAAAKKNPALSPLLELHGVWDEMRHPRYRLRKSDGRLGPLTIAARRQFYVRVIDIQRRAGVELITPDDTATIERCWRDGVYPRGWSGTEPIGTDGTDGMFE